jgi:hypothetical protein
MLHGEKWQETSPIPNEGDQGVSDPQAQNGWSTKGLNMGMTPEAKVKKAVKKLLTDSKQWGKIYMFWPVQSGYGSATLDCLGCYRGRAFAIETKAPGAKPTARQRASIRALEAAGAEVFVIDGDLTNLEAWLGLTQYEEDGGKYEKSDWED